jgi:hypothetical protein
VTHCRHQRHMMQHEPAAAGGGGLSCVGCPATPCGPSVPPTPPGSSEPHPLGTDRPRPPHTHTHTHTHTRTAGGAPTGAWAKPGHGTLPGAKGPSPAHVSGDKGGWAAVSPAGRPHARCRRRLLPARPKPQHCTDSRRFIWHGRSRPFVHHDRYTATHAHPFPSADVTAPQQQRQRTPRHNQRRRLREKQNVFFKEQQQQTSQHSTASTFPPGKRHPTCAWECGSRLDLFRPISCRYLTVRVRMCVCRCRRCQCSTWSEGNGKAVQFRTARRARGRKLLRE